MKQLKDKKNRGFNDRINYGKISSSFEMPNLVEIQTASYNWFITEGIGDVFEDIFPIESPNREVIIEYESYRIDEPKYTVLQCKERGLTYSGALRVRLGVRLQRSSSDVKVKEIFMGDLPLMTKTGTFIINGAERVIVSQIVRSPGAYMNWERHASGKIIYNADLNPNRGTWLKFETDTKNILNVRIDRQRKLNATLLLKALGLTDIDMLTDLFDAQDVGKKRKKFKEKDESEYTALENTYFKDGQDVSSLAALTQIFKKLKPGEPISNEGVKNHLIQKFFDPKRYDLGMAGRFKYNSKLGVYERLVGVTIAQDLVRVNGEIVFLKDTYMTRENVDRLQKMNFFEEGAHTFRLDINEDLQTYDNLVNVVEVYTNEDKNRKMKIVGTNLNNKSRVVTIPDIVATFSYFMNIQEGIGNFDEIDHLGNRRVRSVGELIQNQFRIGLSKIAKSIKDTTSTMDLEKLTPQKLVNIRNLTTAIREFFATSQLSQFMDQVNPLAELTNKRRISALGPGGLSRQRASFDVRDVHYSHYGRICPIETPEGQNIGLINNLACYARVNKFGFLETPYRRVIKPLGQVTEDVDYLSADDERVYIIADANVKTDENNIITNEEVIARRNGETLIVHPSEVDYIDVSPKQLVSIAAASIPFLENDDSMRALMGSNMQRQALPLIQTEAPLVGTGLEARIAHDSGSAVVAPQDGTVTYVDSKKIVVQEDKEEVTYSLQKYARSNQGTCFNQTPIVKKGDKVKKGQVIADGPAMKDGELSLGRNVTIAFMTWNGYNFEDAVIMSERLVKDDVYTTIHFDEYKIETRETKMGDERITRDIPNVSKEAKANLDEDGIVIVGTEVKEGDILVGRVTPKGTVEPSPEDKLLLAIFGDKIKDVKDTSMRVPHGGGGTVQEVKIFTREENKDLPPGVNKQVIVYIAQKRKIREGDKMSGRHGNKGVISRILPECDMPFMEDGTPIDIMLNPLGVPSRMNIGQILEIHLGMACKKLGIKIATPVFDGMTNEEIMELMKEAGMKEDGKQILYDGRTGDRFDQRISVGVMYMIKLVHMVDDKLHARATGPYSLVTQQPLGGKAQNGGQRFGEMEVWALQAYGAAHTLQEILTIKSDDRVGRKRAYEAIVKGYELPKPSIPEAFKVLVREMQGLAINVELFNQEGEIIDFDELAREQDSEMRRARRSSRRLEEEQIDLEAEGVTYQAAESASEED
ncbi:MAG: DNA-directed RNA polymerase subunit beta [Bacilli bacterium]|jgi:DNA-directed RNA polymerase subunit beta